LRGLGDVSDAPEAPIIIWTFRRTGGSTLRSVLYWLSVHQAWQDEAFNPGRELGDVTRGYELSRDEGALRLAIARIVAQRKNLKHAVEVVPHRLNSVLLEEAAKQGYRHLLLLRLNEAERQISLALARRTDAWGPEKAKAIFEQIRRGTTALEPLDLAPITTQTLSDAAALGRLYRLLLANGTEFHTVLFEELYAGPVEARLARFRRVGEALGLAKVRSVGDDAFRRAATEAGQDTRSIYAHVPNIEAVRQAVDWLIR
jgi:hypothetical protein